MKAKQWDQGIGDIFVPVGGKTTFTPPFPSTPLFSSHLNPSTPFKVHLARIAVVGNLFSGIEAVLGVEQGEYCARIVSAGGALS